MIAIAMITSWLYLMIKACVCVFSVGANVDDTTQLGELYCELYRARLRVHLTEACAVEVLLYVIIQWNRAL